jgi:hypothetical protein
MAESSFQISAVLSVGESNAAFVAWTSATAVNSTAILVNADFSYNTIVVSLNQTSTISGGVVTFQGSLDGVTWFNVEGASPVNGAGVGPTYTLTASTYSVFTFNLTAIPYFQVLLSTAITGTATVTIGYSADSFVNTFFPIGSGSGGNASVGPNGSPIPSDSTLIGSEDSSGNLQPASVSNPVPVKNYPAASVGEAATNVTISTSSATVLAANSLRRGVNICNISFGTVSLAFGAAAVIYTGVTLGPGGTFWMDDTDFTTQSITAISSQSNTTIAVQEFE